MGSAPRKLLLLSVALISMFLPSAATGGTLRGPNRRRWSRAGGGSGSTIGPDGALYVTESAAGRITRVDPVTGAHDLRQRAAELLPAIGFGGRSDVAFLGRTAYVLVTLVGPDVGGSDIVGVYRVDGPDRVTVVADLGTFSIPTRRPPTSLCPAGPVRAASRSWSGSW